MSFCRACFFVFFLRISAVICIGVSVAACGKASQPSGATRGETVVVGVGSDFDHLNPLLIQLSISREVCTLLFPTLVRPKFDAATGELGYGPSLATSWRFSEDGKTATFTLRGDAKWSDGVAVTSADLKFSYRLYADTNVASTRQHYLDDLLLGAKGQIDFERAVETPSDTVLVLHFNRSLAAAIVLDHFYDLMPVAKHIFESIPPRLLRTHPVNLTPVVAGPFKVERWSKSRELVLVSNPASVLPHRATVKRMIFRVIPEYTTRLTELRTGSIDVMMAGGGLAPKDAAGLQTSNPEIDIKTVRNRYFDSIVWLNIDGDLYRNKGVIKPNFFFGDKRVRQAMTYAINRQAIIDGFMQDYGHIVNTSLSPAYQTIIDTSLHGYGFNPDKARQLLAEAGWTAGSNGKLQKDGRPFAFTLWSLTGNARRNYAATIIQQNLKDIGIECKLEFAEPVVFSRNQNAPELRYDAAISGLSAETLPFQLIIWNSDFKKSPFNSACFQSARLDTVVKSLGTPQAKTDEQKLWREFQRILHEEQPRTFLYYYDELEGFNRRITNAEVSMLAVLFNAYDWQVK
ncbi:MAG: ABC transporter substrate-binding protein [Rhizobacter sp.]|nr:ABC transporter substrate-binding protein [Chlorobiales bacterium]